MSGAEGFVFGLAAGILTTVLAILLLLANTPRIWQRPPARTSTKIEPAPRALTTTANDGKIIDLMPYARQRRR